MRKRSPAKSADSSPPVPARISRKTLRSSFGILRQQHPLQLGRERRHASPSRAACSSSANAFIAGSRAISSRGGEIALGARVLAVARDDGLDLGVLARQRAIAVEVARRVLGDDSVASSSARRSASDSSLVRSEDFIWMRVSRAAAGGDAIAGDDAQRTPRAPSRGRGANARREAGRCCSNSATSSARSASPAWFSACVGACRNLLVRPRASSSSTCSGGVAAGEQLARALELGGAQLRRDGRAAR